MAYRREDIERVREVTDLVELVSEVTKVKRSGRSVMAVCPFHQEKTASMSVDPARGLYHCFGCGRSGDIFRFVQETQALDFSDAVELLARRSGVTLQRDPEATKRRDRRQVLVDATEAAVAFYHTRLKTAPDAGNARRYLRGRGYEGDVVERFQIGYAPSPGEVLVGHLHDRGIPEDVMVTAGLAIRARTGRVFDRFRGRIMFPIFDVRGDSVGFGARLLDGDGPKYLNSPETPIYRKSLLLYGLNWAKSEIVRGGEAVVVEGYTDVIALHLAGMPIAVATCGTALGEEHLDLLRRFTERVVLMFDADEAGVGASLRGFERSVPGDLDLRVAALPLGRDPADVVAAGDTDAIRKSIESSAPLLQFRIERELEQYDLDDPAARARAVRAAAALAAAHPDELARADFSAYIERRVVTPPEGVRQLVEQLHRGAATRPTPAAPREQLSGVEKAERDVLRLMLANDPGVRGQDFTELFSRRDHIEAYRRISPALEALEPGEEPDLGSLLGHDDSEPALLLKELALDPRPPGVADEVVTTVKVGALGRRIESLTRKVQAADQAADPQAYSAMLQELIALRREQHEMRSHE